MPKKHARLAHTIRSYIGLLLLLSAAFAVFYSPQPMLYAIATDLGVGKGSTGMVVGICQLSFCLFSVLTGLILARTGTRVAVRTSALVLGLSGFGMLYVESFPQLLAVRALEALMLPVLLTSVLASIAGLFRHLDLKRGMAGYVTFALIGGTLGRVLGGVIADFSSWKVAIASFCFLALAASALVWNTPETMPSGGKLHKPKEYLALLRVKGMSPLIYADSCGTLVFAGMGNLLAFRMAELGNASSLGVIGLMYLGYGIGLISSVFMAPLLKLFGGATRMLLAGASIYIVSVSLLLVPMPVVMFGCIFGAAFGQLLVHALTPGLINKIAASAGCDRGMVNGLFLSCFYLGGLIGSFLPGVIYSAFNWTACISFMLAIEASAILVLFRLNKTMPQLS